MFTIWHGIFLGTHELRIEAPPLSTAQGKYIYIYTIFKAENQEIPFLLLCTKTNIDIRKFCLSKVGSLGANLSTNTRIERFDLWANRATIVESSRPCQLVKIIGLIYRPITAKRFTKISLKQIQNQAFKHQL